MKANTVLALLVVALVGGGCKKDAPAGGAAEPEKFASCNMPSMQSCREYNSKNLKMGTDILKRLCDPKIVSSSEFKEVACPKEKVIASCQKPEGKDVYYEGYFSGVDELEKACSTMGGTFAKGK